MRRDADLRRCHDLLASGKSGVVIVGAPGVGKTTLAQEFAQDLCDEGREIVSVRATPAMRDLPFGAVASLFELPSSPTTAALLVRRAVSSFTARSQRRRVVLTVDDAHHLDDLTAIFIHQLALAGTVFVVVTVRQAETVADSITALWKDGLAGRVDVDELDWSQAKEFVESLLPERISEDALRSLYEVAGGNPMFLKQLVASAQIDGALVLSADNMWEVVGALPLPRDLQVLIADRLTRLSATELDVIELLALGEPLDTAILDQLVGDDGVDCLSRLEGLGFVSADWDGRRLVVRLGHPLFGEAVKRDISAATTRRAYGRLATALTAHGLRRSDDALRAAVWMLESGEPIPKRVAREGAEKALLSTRPELAARILSRAEDVISDEARSDPDYLMLMANIAGVSGRSTEALTWLDAVDTEVQGHAHEGVTRSASALLRAEMLGHHLGRFDEALALPVPPDGDAVLNAQLIILQSIMAASTMKPHLAAEMLATVTGVPRGGRTHVWQLFASAIVDAALGRGTSALNSLDEAESTFRALGWAPALPEPALFVMLRMRISLLLGRLDDATSLAATAFDLQRDGWPEQGVAWLHLIASTIERVRGHAAQAIELARLAAETFARVGADTLGAAAQAELAAAFALVADGPNARRCVETATHLETLSAERFIGPYQTAARAWAEVAEGHVEDGRAILVDLLAERRGTDARDELSLIIDIIRLGGAEFVGDHTRELAHAAPDSWLVTETERWQQAAVAGDAHTLDEIGSRLEREGYGLLAADALAMAAAARLR